jgi:hypothetical protein
LIFPIKPTEDDDQHDRDKKHDKLMETQKPRQFDRWKQRQVPLIGIADVMQNVFLKIKPHEISAPLIRTILPHHFPDLVKTIRQPQKHSQQREKASLPPLLVDKVAEEGKKRHTGGHR